MQIRMVNITSPLKSHSITIVHPSAYAKLTTESPQKAAKATDLDENYLRA